MKRFLLFAFLCLLAPFLKAQDTVAKKTKEPVVAKKAADTIVKRNGERLVVSLSEIDPDEIAYKRYDYQDGPVFKISKGEVKFIMYGNGDKESYENYVPPYINTSAATAPDLTIQPAGWKYYYKGLLIPEQDMLDVARKLKDKKIDLFVNRVEKKKAIQYIVLIAGGLLFLDGLYLTAANRVSGRRHGLTPSNNASEAQSRNLGRVLMVTGIGCAGVSIYFRFARRHSAHMVMDLFNQTVVR